MQKPREPAEDARRIYDALKEKRPVLFYRGLTVSALLADRPCLTLSDVWLPDERKHRAMRARGIPESDITGNGSNFDKVKAFLTCLPQMVGSAIPEAVMADLIALGGCEESFRESSGELWHRGAEYLAKEPLHPSDRFRAARGALVGCTIEELPLLVGATLPARPVLLLGALTDPTSPQFLKSLQTVAEMQGISICDLATLTVALTKLVDTAAACGCRGALADYSTLSAFVRPNPYGAEQALKARLQGQVCDGAALLLLRAQIERILGQAYAKNGFFLIADLPAATECPAYSFSVAAFEKLLQYLQSCNGFVRTLLRHSAAELPVGLATLLGKFAKEDGTPQLTFGISGVGATRAALENAIAFYLEAGCGSALVGIAEDDIHYITAYARENFATALAAHLGENNAPFGYYMAGEYAAAIHADNAAAFFGFH